MIPTPSQNPLPFIIFYSFILNFAYGGTAETLRKLSRSSTLSSVSSWNSDTDTLVDESEATFSSGRLSPSTHWGSKPDGSYSTTPHIPQQRMQLPWSTRSLEPKIQDVKVEIGLEEHNGEAFADYVSRIRKGNFAYPEYGFKVKIHVSFPKLYPCTNEEQIEKAQKRIDRCLFLRQEGPYFNWRDGNRNLFSVLRVLRACYDKENEYEGNVWRVKFDLSTFFPLPLDPNPQAKSFPAYFNERKGYQRVLTTEEIHLTYIDSQETVSSESRGSLRIFNRKSYRQPQTRTPRYCMGGYKIYVFPLRKWVESKYSNEERFVLSEFV